MAAEGQQGVPEPKRWRKKRSSSRPDDVTNHLERDFQADSQTTKWVTDIVCSMSTVGSCADNGRVPGRGVRAASLGSLIIGLS